MKRRHEILREGGILPIAFPEPFSLEPQPGTQRVGGGGSLTGIGGDFGRGGGHWEGDPPESKEWESPEHEAADVFSRLWGQKFSPELTRVLQVNQELGNDIVENIFYISLQEARISRSFKEYLVRTATNALLKLSKSPGELVPLDQLGISLTTTEGDLVGPNQPSSLGIFKEGEHLQEIEINNWVLHNARTHSKMPPAELAKRFELSKDWEDEIHQIYPD